MNSEYSEISILFDDIFDDKKCSCCNHINSPYYNKIVDDTISCRLFEDEKKYFLKKDRKDKFYNLNDIDKFKDL